MNHQDNREAFSSWIDSQYAHARLKAARVLKSDFGQLSWADRIRKTKYFAPFLIFFYCLFKKGLVWNGWPGFYSALKEVFSETLLSLYLIEHDLKKAFRRRAEKS